MLIIMLPDNVLLMSCKDLHGAGIYLIREYSDVTCCTYMHCNKEAFECNLKQFGTFPSREEHSCPEMTHACVGV